MTYALHYVVSLKNATDHECLSLVSPTGEHWTLCSTFLHMMCWCRNSLFPFSIQLGFGFRFWHRNRRNAESEMFSEPLILYTYVQLNRNTSPDNIHDLTFSFSPAYLFSYHSVKTHLLFYHYTCLYLQAMHVLPYFMYLMPMPYWFATCWFCPGYSWGRWGAFSMQP